MPNLNCLVVGGSKGIGSQIAIKFLENGYRVVSVSRTPINPGMHSGLFRSAGESFQEILLDLYAENSCSLLIKQLVIYDFLPDVVIFAIGGPDDCDSMRFEDYSRILKLNFLIPVELTLGLLPRFKDHKKRKILFIGSLVTKNGRAPLPYVCSKTALLSFVQNLSHSLGKDYGNLEPFVISPGPIEVPGKGLKRLKEQDPDGLITWLENRGINTGRLGSMSEVANLALALCSSEIGYIHGANFEIDGGAR